MNATERRRSADAVWELDLSCALYLCCVCVHYESVNSTFSDMAGVGDIEELMGSRRGKMRGQLCYLGRSDVWSCCQSTKERNSPTRL